MLSENPLQLVLHPALTSRRLLSFLAKTLHLRGEKCFVFSPLNPLLTHLPEKGLAEKSDRCCLMVAGVCVL